MQFYCKRLVQPLYVGEYSTEELIRYCRKHQAFFKSQWLVQNIRRLNMGRCRAFAIGRFINYFVVFMS